MMSATETAIQVMKDLQASDFRKGFEDTVVHRIVRAVGRDHTPGDASQMWSDFCCFGFSYQPSEKRARLEARYGKEMVDLFVEVDRQSEQPGTFVMPEWGTRGT